MAGRDRPRSLAGSWQLRFDGEDVWRDIAVPGCWEQLGVDKARVGPAWYRRRVIMPVLGAGGRALLRFAGVSYHARVFIDGVEVGEHLGIWDAFSVDITAAARGRSEVELTVRVEKPAGLSGGPDSPSGAGAFPLKETLAGFLPYVWGHIFGGIWQDVTLQVSGPARLRDVSVRGWADGRVQAVVGSEGAPAQTRVTVFDPDGREALTLRGRGPTAELSGAVTDPAVWSPATPRLYTARVELVLDDGTLSDVGEHRFGLRTLDSDGSVLRLNGAPIYPRLALSWGWYFDHLDANPGREEVRRDLQRLRALGYNGVKLCLWVPPAYYFELCDELGMLLWLELPMWLPEPSPFFRRQTPSEYQRIVRQVRHHPSVVLYTLGCELDSRAGAELLGPLFRSVKELVGDALVRDNSGSGEAFGGLLDEFAEFHDYHFYAELPLFNPLLDYFDPAWRQRQPFIFGEYADSDTFRDQRRLLEHCGGEPWWMREDPELNPQGARWQYDAVRLPRRVREAGLWERQAELAEISRRQALLQRKAIIEATRARAMTSGYVVAGERDTPISTAGMWDYDGELKFDPGEFRAFNDDLVVLPAFDRRRRWLAGGDRPAPFERWCVVAASEVRVHLVASHFGSGGGEAEVRWVVVDDRGTEFSGGRGRAELAPGQLRGVGLARFRAPAVDAPTRLELRVEVAVGGDRTRNAWSLWVFPERRYPAFGLHDPLGYLSGLTSAAARAEPAARAGHAARAEPAAPLVTTSWDDVARTHVAAGGVAVVVLPHPGPASPAVLEPMPFWREAVKVLERHPAWGDFPHRGVAELQFYGMTPDHALPRDPLPAWEPVLRRVDARTAAVHEYAGVAAIGRGRALFTTLRLAGGLGDQPLGIDSNPAASYLLGCFLRALGADD